LHITSKSFIALVLTLAAFNIFLAAKSSSLPLFLSEMYTISLIPAWIANFAQFAQGNRVTYKVDPFTGIVAFKIAFTSA
jgi:hypothetical protein